jgi:hypothetical protein
LAEQCIAIFQSPICEFLDEVLELLASGLSQSLRTAEVDGVSLHEFRIELVLADDLAKTVANFGASAVTGRVLWRELLVDGWSGADFLR